jgi:hypothetical protein
LFVRPFFVFRDDTFVECLWLSPIVIGHHEMQLAFSSISREHQNMKTKKSISTNANRRLLLMMPVVCSLAFAACSDLAGTPGTHQTVNLQSAVAGGPRTGDYVTIGSRTYNPEARSFDRPWPFGPESGAQ